MNKTNSEFENYCQIDHLVEQKNCTAKSDYSL